MSSNEYKSNSSGELNYHPISTSVYPKNWDGSDFEKYKMTEFNRMSEDVCYNKQKDKDNNKKLKFYTTNHIDLLQGKEELNFFGLAIKDSLFVPGDKIDDYSNLINSKNGGELTNCKFKNTFGQLPLLTTPYRGQVSHGDISIEDSKIRGLVNIKRNACLPRDIKFEERSFTIFDDIQNIETPNPFKSVETLDKGFEFGRNGISGRFVNKYSNKDYHIPATNILNNFM